MIRKEDLVKIGKGNKCHGIKGEISFTFTDDSFDENKDCPFLIFELEGIFVPFRIENIRFTSDSTALIQLKTIDSDEKARKLSNKDVFYPKQQIKQISERSSLTWNYFIGFSLFNESNHKIGEIIDVDETTINVLFVVKQEDSECLIPAIQDFILQIDEEQQTLRMQLPEGLLDI